MAFTRSRYNEDQVNARKERRRREDAAPRLRNVVPKLTSLRLQFEEVGEPNAGHNIAYTQLVIVATGPALFSVPCFEPRCNGVHELTQPILLALRASQTTAEGDSVCQGEVSSTTPCNRTLRYRCEAEYSSAP